MQMVIKRKVLWKLKEMVPKEVKGETAKQASLQEIIQSIPTHP